MGKFVAAFIFISIAAIFYYIQASSRVTAPGHPGAKAHWSYAGKNGIGTAYEQYTDGQYQDKGHTGKISKVWFSLAQGIVTETMFGLIHEAQLQEVQFYIKGEDFLHQEKIDAISHIEYLHKDAKGRPLSLAYKIINRDKHNRYEIEKHIFTDPDTNSMLMKIYFRAFANNITPYLYVNPNIANTGPGDIAWRERSWLDKNVWLAADDNVHFALNTDANIISSTVGFEGVSDGRQDLIKNGKLTEHYTTTGNLPGNVAFTLQLPSLNHNQVGEWQFVFGFGKSKIESINAATQTAATGYANVLTHFNGSGNNIGWEDYLTSLPELDKLSAIATDGGKLLFTSAMVLKAQEDKTHAGAVIASLSNPWGDTANADTSQTGYKAVWPRDFYQVTMAMLAMGDKITPKIAFEYLRTIQANANTPGYSGAPGWFLQKTEVDGTPEWVAVQLDQTAMPIMLGWRLWKEGVFSDAEITKWYSTLLKPAADFLCDGGSVNIATNHSIIIPPLTQQERWEEQSGFSPSTTAAVITGLVAAADIARLANDDKSALRYLATADQYSSDVEKNTFTTQGKLSPDNGKYFLRITANNNPNDQGQLQDRNAQGLINESEIIDAGFLELVRYGLRSAEDYYITESLPELDNTLIADELRVKYEFTFPHTSGTFPGWRRYGRDGYGEDTIAGRGYNAMGETLAESRGRVWPIFTGERGHYELARELTKTTINGKIAQKDFENLRNNYVKGMELFANDGHMIPEQVWDGVGNNDTYHYSIGQGTNSATPLAWSHAEYIKLLRSYSDKKVWDTNTSAALRYNKIK
ncbi:MAG: glycoside hydrolase family 15 protein [Pseudomonadota bacterium]